MPKKTGDAPLLNKHVDHNFGKKCVICSLVMKYGQEYVSFNCGHIYHTDCDHNFDKCPLCRVEITSKTYTIKLSK